jgi:hypothetical protein
MSIVEDYRAPVITEFRDSRGRYERYFTRNRERVKTSLARDAFVVGACVPKYGMITTKGGVARDTQNVRLWLVVKTFVMFCIIVFTEYLAKAFQK